MKRRLVLFALFFAACAVVVGPLSADELAFNLDFWYFNNTVGRPDVFVKAWAEAFHAEDFGRFSADERGILAFADDVLRGQVTRFVMNVNGQRSNVDSKAFEPVWRNGFREGMPEYEFVRVSKSFHDRGIDPYAIWTRRCREKGVEPWISVRMNDMHRADHEGCPSISDWWREHREFRRYPDSIPENVWFWESQSLDFAHGEVRDRIFAYIEECLGKYDVDGLELDWTRFPWVFAPGKECENAPLLTDLVRKIRRAADAQAAKRGHRILVSCRMLACPETEIALGRDVGVWAREGLIDIADVGNHWKTADYEIPVARWRAVLGEGVKVVPHVDCGLAFEGGDGRTGRRLLTREEYLGWVDVMRSRGCADFSLFNLFGHDSRSPEWNETLVRGFDPRETTASPRRYPLSYRDWGVTGADRDEYPQRLPCELDKDFVFELPVGTVGASDGAELILGFGNERGSLPSAEINGTALPAFASRPEAGCFGFSAAFPASILKIGHNRVRVSACVGRRLVYAAIRVVPGGCFRVGTAELQEEIDAVAARGGGTVTVRGKRETKPFVLKSNVTLELAEGAVLLASTNIADYAAAEGGRCFVFAEGATNVAIVGKGTIDGRGWAFKERKGLKGESQPQALPVMMRFSRCRDLRLEDFTYRDCGAWGCHLRNCDGVTVRRVTCFNHVNNTNDGIDIESSNVVVEDCDIDSDDDAVVFKTESDKSFPVTNVIVRNCRLASCCSALKFGTGSYCDFRDIRVENCRFDRPKGNFRFDWKRTYADRGVREDLTGLSGMSLEVVDGGRMENVTIRNIDLAGYIVPIFIRLARRHETADPRGSYLRDILIENVTGTCATSRNGCSITGVPGLRPSGITLRNVSLVFPGGGTDAERSLDMPELERAYPEGVMFGRNLPAWAFYLRHVDNVSFDAVSFGLNGEDAREMIVQADCVEVKLR